MSVPYTPPKFNGSSYNCPLCSAYAKQIWYLPYISVNQGLAPIEQLRYVICEHCGKYSIWHLAKMIFPNSGNAPMPNPDMPEDIKADYEEARSIVTQSPRGAAALLRLAIQKLCRHLGKGGNDINNDIKSLVTKGLPPRVQQALDIVRVIGNEAVHPGQIDLTDDVATASTLFGLINFIVEDRITKPKEIDALYSALPQNKLDGIKARDKN